MNVITLRGVSKSLRGTVVFNDLTAEFESGKSYAVVGPNGSGKSVLFRLVCRLMLPDYGAIVVSPRYMPKGQSFPEFGILIDGPGYIPSLSARDNLLALANIRKRINAARVDMIMDDLGLDPADRKPVRSYSLGMKQKLGIAQAIMEHQEVLVLDEPFNALDKASVSVVKRMLRQHVTNGGTLLMTSHHQVDVDDMCEHVCEIDKGRLAFTR